MKDYLTGRRAMFSVLGTLVVLVVADGLITNFLVGNRLGVEGNPFLQSLVGSDGFLVLKAAGVLLSAFILWDIFKRQPKLAMISSLCFVVLYTGIVFWNLGVVLITH